MYLSRRRFAGLAGSALASLALGSACDASSFLAQAGNARLKSRPRQGAVTTAKGLAALGLGGTRDAILAMPSAIPATAIPLVVMLHGAGGSADRFLRRFATIPDDSGVAVLSVDSRTQTWDAIRGGFGADVEFLDRALEKVFGQVNVDRNRLAVGGFSDGATYALSLGLANGDLFQRIVAFSPGFIVDAEPRGTPKVFISHGRSDDILPIERCSRVIVPVLRRRGCDVTFREFDGGHEVPVAVATEGFSFVAAR